MANIYLQVDFKTGNIFQFSKTQQEGYESHTNTKGTETFRKVYKKGLYAKLEGVSIRDSNFGKEVSVTTKLSNGDTAYLNFPLFDQNKNIANYAESFISILPSLKIGESYRFFPYNMKGENDKYANIGISVVLADVANEVVIEGAEKPARLTYSYTSKDGKVVKGDIPAVLWEEDVDGSVSMNSKDKKKYLYEVLTKYSTSQTQSSTPSTENQAKPEAEKPKVDAKKKNEDVNDDLPF